MSTSPAVASTALSATMPFYPGLIGNVAVVTGASSGIGEATARYLAANLVSVVLNGRNWEKLGALQSEINGAGGSALAVVADCTKADELETMCRTVSERFGGVDLLIAFAGEGTRAEPMEELLEEKWDAMMDVNLKSKFLTVKTFLPEMKKRGGGSIVLMSSSSGRMPSEATLPYSSAQAGVTMLTRNLAQQLGKDGIRVNAVAPSAIRNQRIEQFMTLEQQASLAATFPIPRLGEPHDVAAATLFLCSDVSSWITGVTLDIAGGKVMM
jgi:3-oxoacyl-[acyl-carrier protein] reductase